LAFLPPTADYSVGQWRQDAMAAIDRAVAAGQQPIVVGGTGLYLKALMQGFGGDAADPAVRQQGLTLLEGGSLRCAMRRPPDDAAKRPTDPPATSFACCAPMRWWWPAGDRFTHGMLTPCRRRPIALS
jgi:hypothetical protein